MKLKLTKVFLFLLLCLYASVGLKAQETFIKRYKNTTLPEGSVAVANLPNNKIAVIGQQSNGFTWQSPMVIITDSTGKQLRHFVDTSCFVCDVYDGAADSNGFIYVVGSFYGKAGIVKYDTNGNKLWQKNYNPFGLTSTFNCLEVINDSMLVAGGSEATDIDGGSAILVMFNANGDTIWSKYYPYSFETGINAVESDYGKIYATGVISYLNQPQQRLFFTTLDTNGGNSYHYEINNGRKLGYGIVPLSPDSILIGGVAYNMFLKNFSFCTLVDSMGNELYTVQDSNFSFTNIAKLDWDSQSQTLYTLSFDTVDYLGTPSPQPKISSYSLPLINLQQPSWHKTIKETKISGSNYMGLTLSSDNTILHSATVGCPYLLKSDSSTCTDFLLCDTTFITDFLLQDEINASLTLYPNPYHNGYLGYDIQSSVEIKSLALQCFGLNGQQIDCAMEENGQKTSGEIMFTNDLAKGVYFLQFLINGQYKVYSRVVKIE